jgi:ABC-type multidrug transport system fused ATPase/permease subunit
MASKREFSVQSAYRYDQRSALRWIWSHIWRYKRFFITTVACFITAWLVYSRAQLMIGKAAAQLLNRGDGSALLAIALTILGLLIADGLSMLVGSLSAENIASRISTDAREELYISLLGKSQTFHDRQRVGDLMARATDDVSQLGSMIVPGGTLIFEAILGIAVPLATIATLRLELLIVPLGFVICYIITVRRYMRRLNSVARRQREQFGSTPGSRRRSPRSRLSRPARASSSRARSSAPTPACSATSSSSRRERGWVRAADRRCDYLRARHLCAPQPAAPAPLRGRESEIGRVPFRDRPLAF